jgi:hypothetical protein
MLSSCPFCRKEIRFNDAQKEKVEAALQSLQEGKCLKIGCPQCKKTITLDKRGNVVSEEGAAPARPKPAAESVGPPTPPDLSWLVGGEYDAVEVVEDVPKVLLLVKDPTMRSVMDEAFSELGYMPVMEGDMEKAMDRMRFESFKGVVYHTAFEGKPLAESVFHQHMSGMAMSQRRFIYYILAGPELHTLYDLEALAFSANLVVNDKDVHHMGLILRKGLTDYEFLFGPFLSAMREFGKK